ncbi:MAG: flippase-like domain-containing protein [Bdellovibrionales bacterium]|nr:flippase-like domain-containing protein [Bdellovibrionales bacterium]
MQSVRDHIITKLLIRMIPWLITFAAIYFAFRDVDWQVFFGNLKTANLLYILCAIVLTIISYFLRSYRWVFLFPKQNISFYDSAKVLFLGFFMNNILPARTGELVRAHFGAKVTKNKRTHVLGTIASERLADGLTISVLFTLFGFHLGSSKDLDAMLYISIFFAVIVTAVLIVLAFRNQVFSLIEVLASKTNRKVGHYASDRIKTFIDSLSPLCSFRTAPRIAIWSLSIWIIELFVYWFVSHAFSAQLELSMCVLFLAAVNFSSLIPAAPGGIGVIEAVASAVLVSAGVDKELALPMVMVQHIIQIIVVGIPGAWVMSQWKISKNEIEEASDA